MNVRLIELKRHAELRDVSIYPTITISYTNRHPLACPKWSSTPYSN